MAKQPQDNVPTRRVESLSASYFDGSPSQASFEKIEERVLGGFGRYATLNADAKETAAEKRELKEKMTPWLKVLRTRLNAKGKKGEGWQRWCAEHKALIGITRKTADRWIDGDKAEEKKKYANLDSADGIVLGGKKYSFKVILKKDRIARIEVEPATAADELGNKDPLAGLVKTDTEIEQAAKSVAGKNPSRKPKTHAVRRANIAGSDLSFSYCGKSSRDEGVVFAAEGKKPTCGTCLNHPEYQRTIAVLKFRAKRAKMAKKAASVKKLSASDTRIAIQAHTMMPEDDGSAEWARKLQAKFNETCVGRVNWRRQAVNAERWRIQKMVKTRTFWEEQKAQQEQPAPKEGGRPAMVNKVVAITCNNNETCPPEQISQTEEAL